MIRRSPGIRAIALEQFTGRYRAAQKQARDFGESWPGDPVNENLALWTAIALAAGVGRDLPPEVCAAIEIEALFPARAKFLPSADRFCREWGVLWVNALAELVRARDVARARAEGSHDQRRIQRAIDLTELATALGAAPVETPASFEGREAA